MGRPVNDDLYRPWKICIPAPLAGATEHVLFDRVHNRPIYGARAKLFVILLEMWHDHLAGRPMREFPSIEEVRDV